MLTVTNPANGRVIAELAEHTPDAVASAYLAARAAQPEWAAQPLAVRLQAIRRFRAEPVRELERLAAILTAEVGKPIRQSRSIATHGCARTLPRSSVTVMPSRSMVERAA